MKKFKAIISDIDGTMVPNGCYELPSAKVTQSIRNTIKNGYIFSMASGRPWFLIEDLIKHLGINTPCIIDNGATIIDSQNGSTLWEAILPTEHANKILKLTKNFKLVRVSCDLGGFDNPLKISKEAKVRKISIHDISMEKADELIYQITNEFNDVATTKAASGLSQQLVDVYFSHILATKQNAVLQLAKLLGISTEEMIGIGDGYNDFSLLMACGLKIAMANAVDDLKQIADEIAPSVDNDGLANILDKYFV
jgi:hypothetical protein